MNLRRWQLAAVLFTLATSSASARRPAAIISGVVDFAGHPQVGAIDTRELGGVPIVTSGVLVSPTVFLTAGHITHSFDVAGLALAKVTFDPFVSASSVWHVGTVHTNPAYENLSADDPGDLGVIVFDLPIPGISSAILPGENLLDQIGPRVLNRSLFSVVGYGVSAMLGGANGGGPPIPDFASGGRRKVADESFLSITRAWIRLGMHENGAVCAGDSGSPNFFGGSSVIAGITVGSISGCKNENWAMRVDTPSARAFLRQYVTLP